MTGSAWECPRCHRINAFWVGTCQCPPPTFVSDSTEAVCRHGLQFSKCDRHASDEGRQPKYDALVDAALALSRMGTLATREAWVSMRDALAAIDREEP